MIDGAQVVGSFSFPLFSLAYVASCFCISLMGGPRERMKEEYWIFSV